MGSFAEMRVYLIFLGLFFSTSLRAQDPTIWQTALKANPYFNLAGPVTPLQAESIHAHESKEILFYGLVGLLLVLAILRLSFPKYFNDLFRLFFRTTLKQRHLSEQMSQTPLPSFILNIYFFIAAGLYLSFWIDHLQKNPFSNFWWLLLYVTGGVTAAYLIKYISLKLTGWLFRSREAVESYTFTVFTINKMMGLFLLPLLVLLAFSKNGPFATALTISWCGLAGLLLYRMVLSYQVVRKQVSLSGFHFILYVAGFEISPLLILYKVLLLNFG